MAPVQEAPYPTALEKLVAFTKQWAEVVQYLFLACMSCDTSNPVCGMFKCSARFHSYSNFLAILYAGSLLQAGGVRVQSSHVSRLHGNLVDKPQG